MNYDVVIGLEVHIQIKTNTKMFCSCPNSYGEEANSLVCPICLGYPGVLPVPNKEAIRKTMIAGLMCNCPISEYSKFDRKSYFYPDMPKNYQITQYDFPFCLEGKIEIAGKGLSGNQISDKKVRINRIHLEEDVGKSVHLSECSGIDFNRAGVPLLEIVSEPDISSADEAYAYLSALKQVMQYGDISDCDMEKGQMRCDVNISLKPENQTFHNPKTELKNLNSFKAAHRGIAYEMERQSNLLDKGAELIQATRGWNDELGKSYLLRVKESEHDYRYFPEPDLMPIVTSKEELEKIRSSLKESPQVRKDRFVRGFGLPDYDAGVLTANKDYAEYFEECVKNGGSPKKISNWIMGELLRKLSENNLPMTQCPIKSENLASLVTLIDQNVITGKIAKSVFKKMFDSGLSPKQIVEEEGIKPIDNPQEILDLVKEIIQINPGPVQEFREGKKPALNFLVGQVMKKSKGKVNPQLAVKCLKETIG